jgi:hypothetical protein
MNRGAESLSGSPCAQSGGAEKARVFLCKASNKKYHRSFCSAISLAIGRLVCRVDILLPVQPRAHTPVILSGDL